MERMRMDDSSDNQPLSGQHGTISQFNKQLSRRTILHTGAGLLMVVTGAGTLWGLQRRSTFAAPPPGGGTPNAVIQWNNAGLQAIRDISPGPTIASRALAIMHTCMYDAWATYDPRANPTRPNGIPRQHGQHDATQAVSYAAFNAMMDLFPSDASVFTSLMQSL